jgi:hypothetical protein
MTGMIGWRYVRNSKKRTWNRSLSILSFGSLARAWDGLLYRQQPMCETVFSTIKRTLPIHYG